MIGRARELLDDFDPSDHPLVYLLSVYGRLEYH